MHCTFSTQHPGLLLLRACRESAYRSALWACMKPIWVKVLATQLSSGPAGWRCVSSAGEDEVQQGRFLLPGCDFGLGAQQSEGFCGDLSAGWQGACLSSVLQKVLSGVLVRKAITGKCCREKTPGHVARLLCQTTARMPAGGVEGS